MDILNFIKQSYENAFLNSPFKKFTSINVNTDGSISFISSGQKLLGFQIKNQQAIILVKEEYCKEIDFEKLSIFYEIANLKSTVGFTRFIVSLLDFEQATKYLFGFAEKYVDDHFIPDYTYDCCHLYMQCSDARSCLNPDRIHAKSCTYRKKIEEGRIFFGNNRNIDKSAMDFVVIDFETANAKRTSACSLGITIVENNQIVESNEYLIKPYPFKFDATNVDIHGITESKVKDAPTFNELWPEISHLFKNRIVVAHNTSFDISVLCNTLDYYAIPFPDIDFLCTYRISQFLYPEFPCYRLDYLSQKFNIPLCHHNACSDSIACANLLIKYINDCNVINKNDLCVAFGTNFGYIRSDSYCPCRHQSFTPKKKNNLKAKDYQGIEIVHSDEDFVDKYFVFTGALLSMTRAKAMEIVAKGGGFPQDTITLKTDYLVVGVQDLKITCDGQSGKMKKAADYKSKGSKIEVIGEDQFLNMIDEELLNL